MTGNEFLLVVLLVLLVPAVALIIDEILRIAYRMAGEMD